MSEENKGEHRIKYLYIASTRVIVIYFNFIITSTNLNQKNEISKFIKKLNTHYELKIKRT